MKENIDQKEKKSKERAKKGFTLIELIVCVTLLGVLMALIIPSMIKQIDSGRESAAISQCMSCVSTAAMGAATGESWATIDEEEVPLAALPSAKARTGENTEQQQSRPILWEQIEDSAQTDGKIIDLKLNQGVVEKMVYITENGKYTVVYENGEYTATKN